MKNSILLLTLCMLGVFCICSCEDNKGLISQKDLERLKKSEPEFDSDLQVIYYKEEMKYDIKSDVDVLLSTNNQPYLGIGCRFSFFNYGEDIRLFNGCVDDSFVTSIGALNYVHVLDGCDEINFDVTYKNRKYGEWAISTISLSGNYLQNVFVTPLALKAYKDNIKDSFILIQFSAANKFLNVLFYGGPKECEIIKYYPQTIIPDNSISNLNDRGRFWHEIN